MDQQLLLVSHSLFYQIVTLNQLFFSPLLYAGLLEADNMSLIILIVKVMRSLIRVNEE